jgi:type II secretory pathway pseudopilin PulG
MFSPKAITLLELIIVIVIVGIVAGLALPNYYKMREQAFDKEAVAFLRQINAAQKIHLLEKGNFSNAGSDTALISDELNLFLPTSGNLNWLYYVTAANSTGPWTCCAQATRVGGTRTWRIRNSEDEPVADDTCP